MSWLDGNPHRFGECKSESNNVGWKLLQFSQFYNLIIYYMTKQHGFKSHSDINTRPCTPIRVLGQVLSQKELI